jgi:hypothetical protein
MACYFQGCVRKVSYLGLLMMLSCTTQKIDYFGIGNQCPSFKAYLEKVRDCGLSQGKDSTQVLEEIRGLMFRVEDGHLVKIEKHYVLGLEMQRPNSYYKEVLGKGKRIN